MNDNELTWFALRAHYNVLGQSLHCCRILCLLVNAVFVSNFCTRSQIASSFAIFLHPKKEVKFFCGRLYFIINLLVAAEYVVLRWIWQNLNGVQFKSNSSNCIPVYQRHFLSNTNNPAIKIRCKWTCLDSQQLLLSSL